LSGSTWTWTDPNVVPQTSYTYRIKWVRGNITSPNATVNVTTGLPPSPPSTSICNYTVSNGYAYAGFYSQNTTVPSSTSVTAAGKQAHCLLAKFSRYNPGTIDGIFGNNSKAAARQFQTDMNTIYGAHLTVDGLIGSNTWPWLRWYQSAYNHTGNCS